MAEQAVEPDTLFMLDPATESTLIPGLGGFMAGNAGGGALPWQPYSGVVEAPGKYRTGLTSANRNNGYLWMPMGAYLPTNQFTVEMWLNSSVPWSQIADNTPVDFAATPTDGVRININGGLLSLYYVQNQSPSGPVSAQINTNVNPIPANQWTEVAFTYNAGTLNLYVNGNLAGSRSNVPAPQVWSDQARDDGFSILGAVGKGASDLTLSDLRISRDARVPAHQITVSNANDVTVDPSTPTGATVDQNLLGGLHTLGGSQTEAMAAGALNVIRTDKLLTATPIKAGTPDAAHPAAGTSRAYSYDWQVVDRTFAYFQRLGVTPYISIDSTPQILGGSAAPFSGSALTTARSFQAGFSPEVPNDLAAWSQIVKDLVHHVTVEDGYRVPYWGVWNEPDGSSFWNGTLNNYLALYQATVTAVKSVNPSIQVGGPEVASWNPTWVHALISYCATNNLPLDFVSWHYYSGDIGEIAEARSEVAQWAAQAGIPTPRLIVGEWAWQGANLPGSGIAPWNSTNYFLNDWHAAFSAESLMEMQSNNVTEAIYTNPVAESTGTGWNGTGLMSSTEPWANLNVFRMWSMLQPTLVSSTYTGQPGVMAQASTGPGGTLTVLLSQLRYRKDVPAPVAVHLPSAYAGWTVKDYVIDDHHSDAFDAGPASAQLMELPNSTVFGDGAAYTTLAPRSVHLLVVSPPAP
jgi:hypothetical protein